MRVAVLALLVAVAVGCAVGGCGTAGSAQRAAGTGGAARPPASAPAPDAALPRSTAGFADALADATHNAEAGARSWLRTHPTADARPPRRLALYALYQQRLYRELRRHPGKARAVIAALPTRLRRSATDNVAAGRSLLELAPKTRPKTQPRIRPGRAAAPQRLLAWYRQAQRRFGVRWQILAAVNLVESDFNRLRNNSYAGARGPMQFMPSTWKAYGLGGDIRDPRDAIMGAANYLHASGAPASYRAALYHYNPSRLYVDAIMRYARQMQLRPERFFVYWNWQVFVRDWTSGRDKRLTGPGR